MIPIVQVTAEMNERLVCAVLAAQVAAIRDRIDSGVTVDVLWSAVDVMSLLSGLVLELSQHHPEGDAEPRDRCTSAVAAEGEIRRSLESIAFLQAQRHDVTRQMTDCVVTALERMGAADGPAGCRLSPDELAALYVSEEQRSVHAAAAHQFGGASTEPPPAGGAGQLREGADD